MFMSSVGPVVRAEMNGFVLMRMAEKNVVILTVIKLYFTEQHTRDEPVGSSRLLLGLGLGGNGVASREPKPSLKGRSWDWGIVARTRNVNELKSGGRGLLDHIQAQCFIDWIPNNRLKCKIASVLLSAAIGTSLSTS